MANLAPINDPNDPLKQARKDFHQKIFKNPAETVVAMGEAAAKKATNVWHRVFVLGVLAGFFIGLGGAVSVAAAGGLSKVGVTSASVFNATTNTTSTVVTNANPILPKMILGLTFPVCLVLIIVLGAELFTGNVMTMSLGIMAKKITWPMFAINWGLSYLGNFIGALVVAAIMLGTHAYATEPYQSFLFKLAEGKVYDDWGVLLLKGIMCNILVCSAVTMALASEDIASKVIVIYAALFTFIVSGFEHSIANMFYIPCGIFYGANAGFGDFLWRNLLPVTLGNIIGGIVVLSAPYFYLYYVTLAPKVLMPKSEIIASRQRRASGSSPVIPPRAGGASGTRGASAVRTSKQSDRDVEMGKVNDKEKLVAKDDGHYKDEH